MKGHERTILSFLSNMRNKSRAKRYVKYVWSMFITSSCVVYVEVVEVFLHLAALSRSALGAEVCRHGRTVPTGHMHSVENRLASWCPPQKLK